MSNKKGFTLIELVIVIMILGILAAMVIPALQKSLDGQKEETGRKIEQVYKEKEEVYEEKKEVIIDDKSNGRSGLFYIAIAAVMGGSICVIVLSAMNLMRIRKMRMTRFNRPARRPPGYFFHDEEEFERKRRELDARVEKVIQESREQTVGKRYVRKNHDNARRVLDKVRESSKGPLSSMWRHVRRATESVVDILFRENKQPPVQK
jgi:prepilin-type N-terminal cleavage/methylation domain-containing protein